MRGLLKRIEDLESVSRSPLIIYAVTDTGETVTEDIRKVITTDGTLKPGYVGIGCDSAVAFDGGSLSGLDRVLSYLERQAKGG